MVCVQTARYELRPATADDLEFACRLNEANMRGYVEQLRGWDAAAERAEMQKRLASGAYQIVLSRAGRRARCGSQGRRRACT
jgi:hypothetical protein